MNIIVTINTKIEYHLIKLTYLVQLKMWYTNILHSQAKKICKSDKEMAEQFITHLIGFVETQWDYKFELMAVLGFIKDLYLFAVYNHYRDVPLSEFSRVCIGLLILHIKNVDDNAVKVSDFIPLCKNKIISAAMDLHADVIELKSDCYKNTPLETIDHSMLGIDFKELSVSTSNKVLLKILLKIEKKVFLSLDYNVSVSVEQLILVFRMLLAEVDDPYQIVSQLLFLLEVFEKRDKAFDQFILELRKIEGKLLPSVLNEICIQLEEYLKNPNFYSTLCFFCYLTPPHNEEITEIIEAIRQKELKDVDSIMEKLNEIKIVNSRDLLIDTIELLESKYRTQFCNI